MSLLITALSRAGGQTLAIDTPSSLDLEQLSTAELRSQRDRLRRQLDRAPRDRSRELAQAITHREEAEQALAAHQPPTDRPPTGMLRWLRRDDHQSARIPGGLAWPPNRPTGPMTGSGSCVSTSNAASAGSRPTPTSARSIGRWCGPWPGSGGPPASPSSRSGPAMSWRRSARAGVDPGPAAWRQAAAEIEQYRRTYQVTDPDRALGPEPRDQGQRADRQRARTAIERVHTKQRADRSPDAEPTREPTIQPRSHQQRGRRGPERAAG